LNRQSAAYVKEGIDLPISTLADHVGACAAVLQPLVDLIRAHVFAGERIYGDETPVKLSRLPPIAPRFPSDRFLIMC
jgi:transposase